MATLVENPIQIQKPTAYLKRRKQVKSACANCRKSKTACSSQRPCVRCVTLGLQSTCVDVPRKQREKKKCKELEGTDSFKLFVFEQNPKQRSKSEVKADANPSPCSQLYQSAPPYSTTNSESGCFYSDQAPYSDWSSSSSPEQSPDWETQHLRREIEKLKRENQEKDALIHSLRASLQSQKMFSSISLSHWKLRTNGICQLTSYSEGFVQLLKANSRLLSDSTFTCVQMYPSEHVSKTIKFFDLVGSGKVESLVARVPLICSTGEIVAVFCSMKVEFVNEKPTYVMMCMQPFDPNVANLEHYFEPTFVKVHQPGIKFPTESQEEFSIEEICQQQPFPVESNSPKVEGVDELSPVFDCEALDSKEQIPDLFAQQDYDFSSFSQLNDAFTLPYDSSPSLNFLQLSSEPTVY